MQAMLAILSLLLVCAARLAAADPPVAEIGNGKIRAKLYLPDVANGFYRGTRFDWSGVIFHLEANGHTYYGPWFTKRNPAIRDIVYEGDDIVDGACSSTTGPADEFGPIGYETAKPGRTFVKIGVGAPRKPDTANQHASELLPGDFTPVDDNNRHASILLLIPFDAASHQLAGHLQTEASLPEALDCESTPSLLDKPAHSAVLSAGR